MLLDKRLINHLIPHWLYIKTLSLNCPHIFWLITKYFNLIAIHVSERGKIMKKLMHKGGHEPGQSCCGGKDTDCCMDHEHHDHTHEHCYTHTHEHTQPSHIHAHEHCCEHTHEHIHGNGREHGTERAHEHTHETELPLDQTLVLLNYTLDHNRSHLSELCEIEANLRKMEKCAAADSLHNSIHLFEKAVAELENALKAAREE